MMITRLQALTDAIIAKLNSLHSIATTGSVASSRLTGTIDAARIPVLKASNTVVSSGDMTALTTPQQADIETGTTVILQDGRSFRYSGTGSKTLEASYIFVADRTPDFSTITGKPSTLGGYGITDGVTTSSLSTTLGNYARFDAAQTLSSGQKTQILTNINAMAADFDPGDLAARLNSGLTY